MLRPGSIRPCATNTHSIHMLLGKKGYQAKIHLYAKEGWLVTPGAQYLSPHTVRKRRMLTDRGSNR